MRGDEGHVGEGNVGGLSGCRLHELVTAELVELGGEEVHRLCRKCNMADGSWAGAVTPRAVGWLLTFNGLVDSYIDRPYTDTRTSTHPYPSRFHLGVGESIVFRNEE